jgi:hypothetical protein
MWRWAWAACLAEPRGKTLSLSLTSYKAANAILGTPPSGPHVINQISKAPPPPCSTSSSNSLELRGPLSHLQTG